MKFTPLAVPEVMLIEPRLFCDSRGHFFESFNRRAFIEGTGVDADFVQDNQSCSARGVLRGLHYQIHQPQGKLVRVLQGRIFDVAVDLRRGSLHFGKWLGVELDADHHRMLWVPAGFAHGFLTLSETADVAYKTTDYYAPEHERSIIWNDDDIGIDWPIETAPLLSDKDSEAARLRDADVFP